MSDQSDDNRPPAFDREAASAGQVGNGTAKPALSTATGDARLAAED